MKSGDPKYGRIFTRRGFWPQISWLLLMSGGCVLSCVFDSTPLFTASILSAFLGLTESSRWSHKTNLLVCSSAAVLGSICGVFSWFDTASVFLLLVAAGGFMLYYRDSGKKFILGIDNFSSDVSGQKDLDSLLSAAAEKIKEMTPGDEVFIALADKSGGLYFQGTGNGQCVSVSRNGGAAWKVFASGRSYMTPKVESGKDIPFYRDARSLMSAPLSAEGEKIGVLQIESPHPGAFSEEDLQKLELIAFVLSHPLYVKLSVEREEKEEAVSE